MTTRNGQLVPVPKSNSLSRLEAIRYALEQARTVHEVKHIRDQAEALRLYAKQAGESLELQNQFGELKLVAERKAGKLLSAMEKNQGARGIGVRSQAVTTLPRLRDLGVSKMQSSRWQREASVPERVFARHIADVQDKGKELTSTGLLDLAKKVARQAFIRKRQRAARAYAAKVKAPEDQNILLGDMGLLWDRLRDNEVGCFFTDPPWSNLECYARLAQLAAAKLKPGGNRSPVIPARESKLRNSIRNERVQESVSYVRLRQPAEMPPSSKVFQLSGCVFYGCGIPTPLGDHGCHRLASWRRCSSSNSSQGSGPVLACWDLPGSRKPIDARTCRWCFASCLVLQACFGLGS
jgi:hypothetical protein